LAHADRLEQFGGQVCLAFGGNAIQLCVHDRAGKTLDVTFDTGRLNIGVNAFAQALMFLARHGQHVRHAHNARLGPLVAIGRAKDIGVRANHLAIVEACDEIFPGRREMADGRLPSQPSIDRIGIIKQVFGGKLGRSHKIVPCICGGRRRVVSGNSGGQAFHFGGEHPVDCPPGPPRAIVIGKQHRAQVHHVALADNLLLGLDDRLVFGHES
jgi:hypothetical protein